MGRRRMTPNMVIDINDPETWWREHETNQKRIPSIERGATKMEDLAAALCTDGPWAMRDVLEQRCPQSAAGRRREFDLTWIIVVKIAVSVFGSARQAIKELNAEHNRKYLERQLRHHWGDRPDRRLSPDGISRWQYCRWNAVHREDIDLLQELHLVHTRCAVELARGIGFADPSIRSSVTNPSRNRLFSSDGTKLRLATDSRRVDPDTGEITYPLDPHADLTMNVTFPGHQGVFLSWHGEMPNQRVIIGALLAPASREGETAARYLVDNRNLIPDLHAQTFDMNLSAESRDLLLAEHIAPVVKMQLDNIDAGRPKLTDCGLKPFTLHDGSKIQAQLWSWNGVPCIRHRFGGRDLVFLGSIDQRMYRPTAAYARYVITDDLRCPEHLRGATVTVRMTAPAGKKNYPARHIGWINEHEDLFWHLHGRRQDSESTNHRFKQTLWYRKNDRAHSHGRASVQFDLIGFALLTNGIAAAEHARLTGHWPQPQPPPEAAESPPLAA